MFLHIHPLHSKSLSVPVSQEKRYEVYKLFLNQTARLSSIILHRISSKRHKQNTATHALTEPEPEGALRSSIWKYWNDCSRKQSKAAEAQRAGRHSPTLGKSQHWSWAGVQQFVIFLRFDFCLKRLCPQPNSHCCQPFHRFQQKIEWPHSRSLRPAGCMVTSAAVVNAQQHTSGRISPQHTEWFCTDHVIALKNSQNHPIISIWKSTPRHTVWGWELERSTHGN